MTNLRNTQQIGKKRNSDKPLEKQEAVLLKIRVAVLVTAWHQLGWTGKWFSLHLNAEGKQLRFSLKTCPEKSILTIILLEQVHKKICLGDNKCFSALL